MRPIEALGIGAALDRMTHPASQRPPLPPYPLGLGASPRPSHWGEAVGRLVGELWS
jgi:hypothetical protein